MKIRAAVSALVLLPALGLVAADGDAVVYGVTDQAGDANGINDGQTLGLVGVDSTALGAQDPAADILGGRIVNVFDEAGDYVGVEFRTKLAWDPTAAMLGHGEDLVMASVANYIHRFRGSANGCEFWVQANTSALEQTGEGSIRLFGGACGVEETGEEPLPPSETVRGEGISWSWDSELGEMVVAFDFADADPRIATVMAPGGRYAFDAITVRGDTGVFTVPVIDQTESPGFRRDTEFRFGES